MQVAALEDASPESRELAKIIRQLGNILPDDASFNWQESRRWCAKILGEYVAKSKKSKKLIKQLEGVRYVVGGDEHFLAHVSSEPNRIYKLTHTDNFGCRSYFSRHDPDLTGRHFHGTGNADPFFYLKRWLLLNSISEFQTRFEGIVPPLQSAWLPMICISQPTLGPKNPTQGEIINAMANYDFIKISQDAFLDPSSELLLTDAAPRNVRIVGGIPVPFDAIAQVASIETMDWVWESEIIRKKPQIV